MNKYKNTVRACFVGYIVQSIVVNFATLLFVTFENQYSIPLSMLTTLVGVNFMIQLGVDFASAFFIDKIGYRVTAVLAHLFAAVGLIFLAVLPDALPSPFVGLAIAMVFYAMGGGLLEVVVSPVVEACPSEHKDRTMSLLHSFYCWGTVGVIVCSSLFFNFFGIHNWKILTVLWAVIPCVNAVAFMRVPLVTLDDGEKTSPKNLFGNKVFWVFVLIMCCAGASEQAVAQWASAFTEKALGISKAVGDLAGPALFSVFMGVSRMVYGKFGEKINLTGMMIFCGVMCIASYLVMSLAGLPIVGLVAMSALGFSVGIMWPGTLSSASACVKGGGTALFSFLALGGDIGCMAGPMLSGKIAAITNDNLKIGILSAVIFPIMLVLATLLMKYLNKSSKRLDK